MLGHPWNLNYVPMLLLSIVWGVGLAVALGTTDLRIYQWDRPIKGASNESLRHITRTGQVSNSQSKPGPGGLALTASRPLGPLNLDCPRSPVPRPRQLLNRHTRSRLCPSVALAVVLRQPLSSWSLELGLAIRASSVPSGSFLCPDCQGASLLQLVP